MEGGTGQEGGDRPALIQTASLGRREDASGGYVLADQQHSRHAYDGKSFCSEWTDEQPAISISDEGVWSGAYDLRVSFNSLL